jgi:serine protease Do
MTTINAMMSFFIEIPAPLESNQPKPTLSGNMMYMENRPMWSRMFAIVAVVCLLSPAAYAADNEINLRKTVIVDVVRKTKDAVVNVSTTKVITRRVSPFGADPFWQQFDFGGEIMRIPANSLGSGFIIHPDGYVVTNNHVIDRARQIKVELADGRKLDADLISADSDADLAILKIASDKPLPTIELGDSSDLMIGEPAIAVGNPLGYSHSVSTGIVSAVHRDLKGPGEKTTLADLIQTDAAINPGNSGGPLLNAYGQVIGINTAIRGDAQNIGFAIQVNRLRDLVPELMNPAQVTKVDIPLTLKETRSLTPPANVESLVRLVNGPPTPIVSINGGKPRDIVDAYAMLLKVKADDKINITFAKDPAKSFIAKAAPQPDAIVQAQQKLGLTIEPLTPLLAEKYKLPTEDGLFVTAVTRNSVGARAGIVAGDVIVQVGKYRISNLKDLSAILARLMPGSQARVLVIRGDQLGYGMLEMVKSE